jgi:hypothetical protein
MVIATFTYTRDRDTRIDFSRAYYKATGRLLVKNDQPELAHQSAGEPQLVTTRALDLRPVGPEVLPEREAHRDRQLHERGLDVQPGSCGHADVGRLGPRRDRGGRPQLEAHERHVPALPYGIGIRQGNTALTRWVNSRLELMRKADRFMTILRNNVPARFVPGFSNNILRPRNTFGYAPADAPAPDTVCP